MLDLEFPSKPGGEKDGIRKRKRRRRGDITLLDTTKKKIGKTRLTKG